MAMSKPTVFCFSSSLVVGLHELLGAYSAWLGEPAAAETEAVPEPAAAETEAVPEPAAAETEAVPEPAAAETEAVPEPAAAETEAGVRRCRRRPFWRKGRVRPRKAVPADVAAEASPRGQQAVAEASPRGQRAVDEAESADEAQRACGARLS